MKEMERFRVVIEKDVDGSYIAYNVDDSRYALIGRGATEEAAKEDFRNSMQEVIAVEGDGVAPILLADPEFTAVL